MTNTDRDNDDYWVDEHAGPVVRPYAVTQGRTRSTRGNLDLISLVKATRPVPTMEVGLGPEHLGILGLCQQPLSVAELAAHLSLPAGTIRVLLDDLLDRAFVTVQEPQLDASLPDNSLYEALINGLKDL